MPPIPEENHAREQYFFDEPTLASLSSFILRFSNPCLLCCPLLARHLHAHHHRPVCLLDTDDRFADVPGYVRWDLYRPHHLPDDFDLILCDPPFFNVSLSQLFTAVRLLCHFDLSRKVMIAYPVRRARALTSVFAPFGLRGTGCRPGYLTVQKCQKNDIEFYANFDDHLPPLTTTTTAKTPAGGHHP